MTKKYTRGNQDVDTSFLTLEMTWHGINDKRVKDQVGSTPPDSVLEIIKNQIITYLVDEEQFKSFISVCAKALLNNKGLLENLKRNTIKTSKEIRELARKNIKKVNILSNEEISKLLLEIKRLQAECTMFGTVVAFADIWGEITNKLIEIIKNRKNLKQPLHIYTAVLGTPPEESLTEQAYNNIKENKDKTDDTILKEYFWLDQGYIGRGLTKEQLDEIRKSLEEKEEEILPSKEELLEELNLSEQEKKVFQTSQDLIYIKALRADSRQFLHVVTNKLIDIIAEKLGIETKYAETLYTEEICNILNKKIQLPTNLEDRWEHSIAIEETENTYKFLTGNEAESFLKEHFKKEEIKDKDKVKGQPAQPGKVRGTVKLVFTPQHNAKVKEGDILVSTATSPQLLPAMKRAAAFVTDVGGITSHAAIVARELKKPCIVGTKHATQIFNDGDIVEVDADKGVVRILQSRPITTLAQKQENVKKNDLAEIFIEMNKGRKLYPPLQSYSAFMLGSGFHLKKYCEKWYGKDVNFDLLILMKEGFSQVWLPEEYMKLTSQLALREYIKNKNKFQKRIDFFNQNLNKMDEFYSKYNYKKINELKSDDLLLTLKELRDLTWSVNAPLICVNDIEKEMCWDTIRHEGFELTNKEFDRLWEKASEPAFESIDKVQLKKFLNLIINKESWSDIVEECQYYLTNYHSAKDLSIVGNNLKQQYNDFLDNTEKANKKLRSESSEIKKIIDLHKKWLNGLSKNQKTLAEYLHSVMLLRDRRKSFINKGLTVAYRIAEQIFDRAGIKKDLIPYYTMDELLLGLEHLVNIKDKLEDRKNGFELLIKYSGEVRMLNTRIEEAVKNINSFFMNSDNKEGDKGIIQGQIGSKGIIRGKVRIVFDVYSNHGFVDKEILVTGMTRPEFVPLMKKAAAIITDEGGITSHAAIVARELRKPCIIGTKIATKVLKDGDLVEVDANKGVVRKIK